MLEGMLAVRIRGYRVKVLGAFRHFRLKQSRWNYAATLAQNCVIDAVNQSQTFSRWCAAGRLCLGSEVMRCCVA